MKREEVLKQIINNIAKNWAFLWLGIFIFILAFIIAPFSLDFGKRFLKILGLIIILGSLFKPEDPEEPEKEGFHNQNTKENARIGYQVATALWTYEGQLVWSRFNAMLVANSIILATIGLLLSSSSYSSNLPIFNPKILISVLSIIGLVLCILWCILITRGFEYHKYYISSARELEERHLIDVVKTVSRGRNFGDGKTVKIMGEPMKMSILGRLGKGRLISSLMILLFVFVYLTILYLLYKGGS